MSDTLDATRVIEALKSYIAAKERVGQLKSELKELFAGKSLRKPEVLDEFKSLLRTAMGKDAIWVAGNAVKGKQDKTEEDRVAWNKRESVRSSVNRKAKEIIEDVFGVRVSAKDAEDAQAVQQSGTSSSESSESEPAVPEVAERPKRVAQETVLSSVSSEPSGPSKKKNKRRDTHDGLLALSDFHSVTTAKRHIELQQELKDLADKMSCLIQKLGKNEDEWFIDGEDENKLHVRWLALKPAYIENIRFRKYKIPLRSEVVLGEASGEESA